MQGGGGGSSLGRELSPVDERPRAANRTEQRSRSDSLALPGGSSITPNRLSCPRVSVPAVPSPTATRPRARTVIKSSSVSGLSLIIPAGELLIFNKNC